MIRPACSPPAPGPARSGARPPVSPRALWTLALALALPVAAHAQDDGGTSTTDNPVKVSFTSGAPEPIGIDNCLSELDTTHLIELTDNSGTTDTRDPRNRLYYYLGSEPCFAGDGVAGCPGTGTAEDDKPCGCIEEKTQASFSFEIADLDLDDVCGADGPDTISLIGQVVYPEEGNSEELTYEGTDAVTITFDRVRPVRPSDTPRLSPGENAIRVRANGIGDDVVRYEVCVRPYDGTAGASPGEGSNAELRGDFASASCASAESLGGDGFRFAGLQNYVNYEVVYAGIDAAGNRGPNSASSVETPVPQLDFAELYTERLGGQQGEQGGCSTTPGRAPSPGAPLAITFALVALAARARRAHGDRS